MKMRKPIALLLSLVSTCSLFACGGDKGNKLTLEVVGMDGGIGNQWLFDLEEEFEEKFAQTQYGDRVGVDLEISQKQGLAKIDIQADGYAVYFAERADIQQFGAAGAVLDITDIVMEEDENGRTIDSLMTDATKARFKDAEGKYWGLPHYTFYSGLSYDVDTFNRYFAYFADSDNNSQVVSEYESKYGTATFIANVAAKKSCGPDGEFGTYDDGLPSSLQELIILCSYLKENGVAPLVLSGQWKNMCNYLTAGLWPALAGAEAISTIYTFDGTIEAIKLDANGDYIFTNELLFEGVEGIYKPETEIVEITEANGHRTTDMVEEYWATAFIEAAKQEGFFCSSSLVSTTTHTGAQSNLIYGSKASGQSDKGMLIDGSYWWNESKLANTFEEYAMSTNDSPDRNIRFMSLPTSLNTTTTEGNGEPVTLLDVGHGNTYVNNNIKNKPEVIAAVRDFLQFVYSDAKLRAFTASTGITRPLDYTLTDEDMSNLDGYQVALLEMNEVGNVVTAGADNDLFRKFYNTFRLGLSSNPLKNTWNNKTYSNSYMALENGSNSRAIMETSRIKPSEWVQYYTPSSAN